MGIEERAAQRIQGGVRPCQFGRLHGGDPRGAGAHAATLSARVACAHPAVGGPLPSERRTPGSRSEEAVHQPKERCGVLAHPGRHNPSAEGTRPSRTDGGFSAQRVKDRIAARRRADRLAGHKPSRRASIFTPAMTSCSPAARRRQRAPARLHATVDTLRPSVMATILRREPVIDELRGTALPLREWRTRLITAPRAPA